MVVGTLAGLLSKLDANANLRGRQFEEICAWYLRNDPLYRHQVSRVWPWAEWPGRWGPDAGIDLVAETTSGDLWAIQAKCYHQDHSITKADVDTFLSESGRPQFSFRLLLATTNRIGQTANRTIDEQEKPAHLVMLADLERSFVQWPQDPASLGSSRIECRTPRSHQDRAIADVVAGFRTSDRGQLLMACGTGKTLTALWIKERLNARHTLVLLPSLSLLSQTLREWTAEESFDFIAVCSDETVVGEDQFVSRTSDLGVPVTTNPGIILRFLEANPTGVVFSTYQSSPRIADALVDTGCRFDLAIMDEAHRCAGPGSGAFATVLDDSAIPCRRRLFMTATPRYFSDSVRREADDAKFSIVSMDDESAFGPVFHRLTFSQAIEHDLLSDYRVAIVGFDDPRYREMADNGAFVSLDGSTVSDARSLAGALGLAKAMREFDLRRVVTFHHRVKQARAFAKEFPALVAWMPGDLRPSGTVWSHLVSGEMPSGEREVILGRLKHQSGDHRGVLTNARCLSEGVDVPSLDGVAFMDPRRSTVDIVQAVGRAIRRSQDKTVGTIVIPVFVDSMQDPSEAVKGSAFRPVWSVLRALRAHDEVLAEELDAIRRELGPRSTASSGPPAKIHFDLPETIGEDFARALWLRVVEMTTSSWEQSFGALLRFTERTGSSQVPESTIADGVDLNRWVNKQRTRYRTGDLTPDRIARLEQLPGWSWNPHEDRWDASIAALRQFAEREGHANVPTKHFESGLPVGSWVNTARSQRSRGVLPEWKVAELERVSGWTWDARQEAWEKGFRHLEEFIARESHARVPKDHREGSFALGNWVSSQRRFAAKGSLAADRHERLAALPGWSWNTDLDNWEAGFGLLKEFAERTRHARVPQAWIDNRTGFPLGRWVLLQRQWRDRMSGERRARLEGIPGWGWNARSTAWDRAFAALKAYVARHGHALVPPGHEEAGISLGTWVRKQRGLYKSGELLPGRADALEGLGCWIWDTDELAWQNALELLRAYAGREGHANVPSKHREDGFPLGQWAQQQRQAMAKGELNPSRAEKLRTVPGWTTHSKRDRWTSMFEVLNAYSAKHGHANPPLSTRWDNKNLGNWVGQQRQLHRQGKLKPDRMLLLEALPGWRWTVENDSFDEGLRHLRDYVERFGTSRVPAHTICDGFSLGSWVNRQRQARKKGVLSAESQRTLEVLPGWSWEPKQELWDQWLELLEEFVAESGHAQVPRDHAQRGKNLGGWVTEQRQNYREGLLSEFQRNQLASMPGWAWSARADWWEQGFCELERYVAEHRTSDVPIKYESPSGFKLGRWVVNQRTRSRSDPSRAERLSSLPGWHWAKSKTPEADPASPTPRTMPGLVNDPDGSY